jgi:FkbM family methyltransferase
MKKKILVYIAPHLSTGGMPQYLFKQIESVINDFDVYCIEWDNVTGGVLVVQRNRIQNLLGNKLITLGEHKDELFTILKRINPDVIHLQEIPELFMPYGIAQKLYDKNRSYVLIETSHDSSYDVQNKTFLPDKFLMVSQYQIDQYKALDIPIDLVEYPIEPKVRTKSREQALRDLGLDPNLKHVINVGLFTPRKNQAEVIEYARQLQHYPIQFHFLGNQADNFKHYWEPLMRNFPKNCKWWNERSDVDAFYEAADLFLFTSKGNRHDKETMPLVIREALSWKTPSMIYNLPVYMGYFDKYDTIEYLSDDVQKNVYRIAEKLLYKPEGAVKHTANEIFYTRDGEQELTTYSYHNSVDENLRAFGDGATQYWYTFIFKELDRGNIQIDKGDVFVDLGANIGMSSRYALSRGASEVHCFEPDPALADLIRKNAPAANIYKYAISNTNDAIQMYHWPHNPINDGTKYTCQTITLKEVFSLVGKKINYLKIDIEGAESNIFDELTAEDCAQVDKLMVEYHHQDGLDAFCKQLERCGFTLQYVDRGHQAFIYARYTGVTSTKINFHSRWDKDTLTIYYSADREFPYPVLVSLKEYKSDAVLWSSVMDKIVPNVEYWMRPGPTDMDMTCGVKICIYDATSGIQLYEYPYVHTFVNLPTLPLSNSIPYHGNFMEYFVHRKYEKWLNKPYDVVVDAGANVGVFASYMIMNEYAKKVVSIECDEMALSDLQRNFKHNTSVDVIDRALHTSTTPITFYHSPENPVISSTLSPDQLESHMAGVKGNVETTVSTVTIPQLLERYGTIDLLKIDIEGAEYDILMNTPEEYFNHIDKLFIECHFFEHNYTEKYNMLLKKLQNIGYIVEEYEQNQSSRAGGSECIFAFKATA